MGREDNVNMDQELKQTIECVYELCEEVEKTLQKTVTLQNPLKALLQTELMMYVMYLTVSDDRIELSESQFLRDYLDYDFSPDEIATFVQNNSVETFRQTVPYTFQLFVKADNLLYGRHGKVSLAACALYQMYETIGLALISADEEIDVQEYHDLADFLTMLKAYMDQHLDSAKKRSVH